MITMDLVEKSAGEPEGGAATPAKRHPLEV
jgi:hypothetical protein